MPYGPAPGCQVQQAALRQQEQVGVSKIKALNVRFHTVVRLLVQPVNIDLAIGVTGIEKDRAGLHLAKLLLRSGRLRPRWR